MNTGKVAFAFIHPGTVAGPFTESLIMLLQHDHEHKRRVLNGGTVLSMGTGPRIASARNKITKMFLEAKGDPEWLLMVDSDMGFGADLADRLVETATRENIQILGGLCFGGGRGGNVFPTLYRMTPPNEDGDVVEIIENYPENALVKVDATGAACLLIHRKALLKIQERFGEVNGVPNPAPWFAETFYAGREFGEDWTFCMRAGQCDIPIYVHTGIPLAHLKTDILDATSYERYLKTRAELGDEAAVTRNFRSRLFPTAKSA